MEPRVLLAVVLLVACSGAPQTIDRLDVANPTDYSLDVQVSGGNTGAWLPLATVEPQSNVSIREVIDQGELWMFRFRRFGVTVGEISMSRDQLEAGDWHIEVPADVGLRLSQVEGPEPEMQP